MKLYNSFEVKVMLSDQFKYSDKGKSLLFCLILKITSKVRKIPFL